MPNLSEQPKGLESSDYYRRIPGSRPKRLKPLADAKIHHEEQISLQKDKEKAIRIKLELARPERVAAIKEHLIEYWELKDKSQVERVHFIEAFNLPLQHRKSYGFMNDDRLAGTMIAVVPDDLWIKGSQPSESSAENDLIMFKESYFRGNDNIGWMTHELTHCLRYKNAAKDYNQDLSTFAFDDLKSDFAYPNNKVEKTAFSRQFEYLKGQGKTREEILGMISKEYSENDLPFFKRLIDRIF